MNIRAALEHQLTRQELRVFPLLMRLQTNKEIAAALGVSERTVKFHVSNILAKARRLGAGDVAPGAALDRVALYKSLALPPG